MNLKYLSENAINHFIKHALMEDVGEGDYSSLSSIPAQAESKAQLIVKESGIIAGLTMAENIYKYIDPSIDFIRLLNEGQKIQKGDIGFKLAGSARSILSGERLVLNCMQRMSGIATYTHYLKGLLVGTGAQLLDTRKTTPNFRMLEKWAVVIGGGLNHRFGLYDMILLKDNHIDFGGGITKTINRCREFLKKEHLDLRIEIETRNLKEVEEVLRTGKVDRIMLDNMTIQEMKQAVDLIGGKYETEASGGITEENIRQIAFTGVDFISVGALTHSIKSIDLSLKAIS